MHGIVSLLDTHHYHLVEDLWSEPKQEFAVQGTKQELCSRIDFANVKQI